MAGLTPAKVLMALSILVGGGGGGVTVLQLGELPGQVEKLLDVVGVLDGNVGDLERQVEILGDKVERIEGRPGGPEIQLMIRAELGAYADELTLLRERIVKLESGE